MEGKPLPFGSTAGAIKAGIGYVPQDRGSEGLVIYLSIGPNMTLPDLSKVVHWGFLSQGAEKKLAVEWIDKLAIKTPGPNALCRISVAAISKKSCWPSGWHPRFGSSSSTTPRAASMWAPKRMCTSSCGPWPRKELPSS